MYFGPKHFRPYCGQLNIFMHPPLRSSITRYTSFVRLFFSVPRQPLTRKRNCTTFKLSEELPTWGVTGRATCRSQGQTSRSLGGNVKIVFRPYLREKYVDLRKVQAVMIRFHGARFIRSNACTLLEITGRQLNFLFTSMEKGRGGVKWERVEIGGRKWRRNVKVTGRKCENRFSPISSRKIHRFT